MDNVKKPGVPCEAKKWEGRRIPRGSGAGTCGLHVKREGEERKFGEGLEFKSSQGDTGNGLPGGAKIHGKT